jgi:hypothetical protein
MNKIYLNPELCKDMSTSYEGRGNLKVHTNTLLRSTSFDETHRNFFQTQAGKTLTLLRRQTDLPGWFWVEIV